MAAEGGEGPIAILAVAATAARATGEVVDVGRVLAGLNF